VPDLKNKTILILSPQAWGIMFISKHHYAMELAKLGNTVYFLNPPDQKRVNKVGAIEIKPSQTQTGLYFIEHRLFFPYVLKFKALPVFHWLMKFHVNQILKKIDQPIEMVWSFDIGNLYPFRLFKKGTYKIFHPVDEPLNKSAFQAAKHANAIFSVTSEILAKYSQHRIPSYFINHGVTEDFFQEQKTNYQPNNPLRIGLSGNLLRPDIDREILLQIIKENPGCQFEFWGSYNASQSNVSGAEDELTVEFLGHLKRQQNIILHGAINPLTLGRAIQQMDAFLICYDVQKDQSKGTNYHKIMEYLATGKVIISNNVSTYKDRPELVQMVEGRINNDGLPQLFKKVISQLHEFNQPELQRSRIEYARDNVYARQIARIESKLTAFDVFK
jgi:hypothetical protein